jgi:serine phosphatase RsbU (regulator of sigma subunit)/PAS domain-containing protein
MVSRPRETGTSRSRAWAAAGLAALVLIALLDIFAFDDFTLVGVLVVVPLITSLGASPNQTATVTVITLLAALPLAAHGGTWGTGRQAVGLVLIAAGGIIAIASARGRVQQKQELQPQALDAQRLRLALDAGQMGTWSWDTTSGVLEWDERLQGLFGLEPGTFDRTFAMYEALLHPDDRERVLGTVQDGMSRNIAWRFDHRCVWPNREVHWLEGRGEPVYDATGAVVGASGVAINVDARHALSEAQSRALEASELSSLAMQRLAEITTALAGAATVDEVGSVIVEKVVSALHARSGYFAIVDEPTNELVVRAQSGYPDWIMRDYGRVGLDQPVPAAEVINSGVPIFIESPEDRARRFPQHAEDPAHAAFVVAPLPPIDEARAVLAFGFAERRTFSAEDRAYMSAVLDACAQALQRATAFEAERSSRARLRTLLVTSEKLAGFDDPERIVETIAEQATAIGNWATIVRILPDGRLERSIVVHRDPALTPLVRDVLARLGDQGTSSLRQVLATGEAIAFDHLSEQVSKALGDSDDLRDTLAKIGYESALLVPISIAGRNLAVLTIADARAEGLRAADIELALDLGRRGASALERAQLWQASKDRLEAEHRIVELLQRTIVPDTLPDIPNVQLGAAYRPAEVDMDVGGDWYDAFVVHDGSLVMAVGDVAGHGIEAASLMGRVRNALRAYANEDADPASILTRLDRLLRTQDATQMVTAFVARFHPDGHTMSWSRAGHPPALVVDSTGNTRFLEQVNSAPLGTLAREYRTAIEQLEPGSLLVSYTDGLIERRDCVLDDGLDWFQQRVREHADVPLDVLCDKLVDDPFVGHPAPDDMCVLALRTDRI